MSTTKLKTYYIEKPEKNLIKISIGIVKVSEMSEIEIEYIEEERRIKSLKFTIETRKGL